MGSSMKINVSNETELNQQIQLYLAQGYTMQSNYNGTAILKKKSYSMAIVIILTILFLVGGVIYYLLCSDNVIMIEISNQTSNYNNSTASNNNEFEYYCQNCGHGLFKDSKFCPGCGTIVKNEEETPQLTTGNDY